MTSSHLSSSGVLWQIGGWNGGDGGGSDGGGSDGGDDSNDIYSDDIYSCTKIYYTRLTDHVIVEIPSQINSKRINLHITNLVNAIFNFIEYIFDI